MHRLRRAATALVALGLLATLAVLAQPSPTAARAGVACDALRGAAKGVSGGVEALTGGTVGFGNPVGDACNEVTGAAGDLVGNPLKGALQGVGKSVFAQITEWVSEGSAWLIGEVAKGIDETTTPKLTGSGFLASYRRMAEIAALMGMAMLLVAIIEGAAQGNVGALVRVALVNLPLALVASSVAYVVVQLLLVATDGLCHAVSGSGHKGSQEFFKAAISGLGEVGGTAGRSLGAPSPDPVGGSVGEVGGALSAPLFVGFLLAIVGAFAAFLVWLELLMRDAAVYVTVLFTPFALAAAIRPRWSGALRRTCELLAAVIGSKFVIVSIFVLAAGMIAHPEGRVEAIIAASALMVLAAFAPFVLLKLVPFAEGAMNAAYSRRSAAGGMVGGLQVASDVQILRGMTRSNWGGSGVALWEGAEAGGGANGGGSGGAHSGAKGSAGAGEIAGAGEAAAAGGAAGGPAGAIAGAAAKAPSAARDAAKSGGERLEGFSEASGAGEAGSSGSPSPGHTENPRSSADTEETARSTSNPSTKESPSLPESPDSGEPEPDKGQRDSSERPPRPAPDGSGVKPEQGEEG